MASTRGSGTANIPTQANAWGLDPETARQWIAAQQPQDEAPSDTDQDALDWAAPEGEAFPVWPENWPALRVWMKVQRCWRTSWKGHLVGLRWGEVESVARMLGLADQATLAEQLDEMQAAAVAADRQDS